MKPLVKKFIAVLFVSGIIITSLLSPVLWVGSIQNYFNETLLKSSGWKIKIKKLSGNFLHIVQGDELIITHKSGASFFIPDFEIDISIFSIMNREKTINKVALRNVVIRTPAGKDFSDSPGSINLDIIENYNINIKNIIAQGIILTSWQDSLKNVEFSLAGGIYNQSSGINIQLDSMELSVPADNFNIFLKESLGIIKTSGVMVDMGEFVINGFPLKGNLDYHWSGGKKITADIYLHEYKLPQKIFNRLPLQPNLSSLDAVFHFESDLKNFKGQLDLSNDLGLNMSGKFSLEKFSDHLFLDNMVLEGNEASIIMQGTLENSGQFKGTFQLDNFDLSQWLYEGRTTQLSGYMLVNGNLKNNQINSLNLTVEVDESKLYTEDNISLSGTVSFFNDLLSIENPVVLSIGPSRIDVTGFTDFYTDSLNLNLELTDASTFLINNFWTDSLSSGQATGSLRLWGKFNNLAGSGNLIFKNFGYRNISLDYFDISGKVIRIGRNPSGTVKTKFGRGFWNKYGFENGAGNLRISADEIEITDFELRDKQDFLQLSATLYENQNLVLEKLRIAYQDHYLVTPDTIFISVRDSGFILEPFELHIDDGIIAGFFRTIEPRQGRMKLSNIPAEIINLIEIDLGYTIKGLIFGEIALVENYGELNYSADLRITNGEIANQPFDDLLFSTFYRNGILYINEFTLTQGQKTGLQVSGTVPINSLGKSVSEVNLKSNFKSVDMSMVTQFMPKWFYLGGVISGDFNISGTTRETDFKFVGLIENTVFDKVDLGTVKTSLEYDSRKLKVDFSAKHGESTFTGAGFIPLDLNLGSDYFGKYSPEDNFDLSIHGLLENFDILSTYLTDVDSIIGNIEINLDITGPAHRLIRNGKIIIDKTSVYTILMDEPVRAISARAKLINNVLEIQDFSGRLYDSNLKKTRSKNTFKIRGSMNMTRFFRPWFNLQIEGKEIFYRSLSRDLEATVDLSLNMTGRDTLDISGVIPVTGGILFTEFNTNEILENPDGNGHITTNFNIRYPIQETFSIINSRIDATIGGEITLARQGLRPWDYYGEIEFIDGKIYYLVGGDVFENLIGRMAFDGNGFNPFLDLSASTRIGETEIRLAVYGPLENPQWIFDSDQGLTESDILQLLTFHSRLSEEGITARGLGTQAQSILGAFLERQFERNFVRVSGLQTLGVENVSISGTNSLMSEESGDEFAITAKMNDKVYFNFNYRRSFGFNRPGQNRIGVEYKLNPYFSLVGNVDEFGEMHMKLRLKYSY
ncbi:MAG: translocation/assembly module TamB domain-containing protein [Candidatus Neomarinimicrobiota bacterium]